MTFGNLAITLIFPDKVYVKYMGEVSSVSTLDNRELASDGLYSQEIFGSIGSEERLVNFGYINLYLNILHPKVFNALCKISSLYAGILAGTKYGIYNSKINDFDPADIDDSNADTGYTFFMKHVYSLKPKRRDVDEVDNLIVTFERHVKNGLLTNNKLLVLPAGMRDISLEADGQSKEDEINEYYKKVISASAMLSTEKSFNKATDYLVYNLQIKIKDLFDYILSINKGKKGYIAGNVSSRAVDYGTRNTLTGKTKTIEDLLEDNTDYLNMTTMGIFQFIKGAEPVVKYCLSTMVLDYIFNKHESTATLFNHKTKHIENTPISNGEVDRWTTSKGLTNLFNRIQDQDVRSSEVMVEGKMLLAVLDIGDTIKIYFTDDGIDDSIRGKLRGITYGELLYAISYEKSKELITTNTRYPVASDGSIYISNIDLISTSISRDVTIEYNYPEEVVKVDIPKYPKLNSVYDDSVSVHYSRLAALGADHDGDQIGNIIIWTKEAIAEGRRYMKSMQNYIGSGGDIRMEMADYISDIVIKTLSRR